MRNVFARERSVRVNHRLMYMSMDGITAASTMPRMKRSAINVGMLLTMPVAAAHRPHKMRLAKISFLTLFFCA